MGIETDKYTVTLCSYHKNSIFNWIPKVVVNRRNEKESVDFIREWDVSFFNRGAADKYALKETKDWISRDSGIKKVFTKEEWAEEKIKYFFIGIMVLMVFIIILAIIFVK